MKDYVPDLHSFYCLFRLSAITASNTWNRYGDDNIDLWYATTCIRKYSIIFYLPLLCLEISSISSISLVQSGRFLWSSFMHCASLFVFHRDHCQMVFELCELGDSFWWVECFLQYLCHYFIYLQYLEPLSVETLAFICVANCDNVNQHLGVAWDALSIIHLCVSSNTYLLVSLIDNSFEFPPSSYIYLKISRMQSYCILFNSRNLCILFSSSCFSFPLISPVSELAQDWSNVTESRKPILLGDFICWQMFCTRAYSDFSLVCSLSFSWFLSSINVWLLVLHFFY